MNGPFDVVVAVRDVAVDGLERDDLQLLKILESKNPEDCIDRWPYKTAKVENLISYQIRSKRKKAMLCVFTGKKRRRKNILYLTVGQKI